MPSSRGKGTPGEPEEKSGSTLPFGRRKTDNIPDGVVESDGRYYILGSHYEDLKVHSRNLSILLESTRSLMAEKDLGRLLELIMQHVTGVMKAERSSLFLIDPVTRELWSRVAQGTSEIRIPWGKGIAGHVSSTGETVNIEDAYQDPNFRSEYDLITGYRTKSILCVPVRNSREEIIGSIEVLNKRDGTRFNEQDESLMASFVSLAGIALTNAQAYEELQTERDNLERLVQSTRSLIAEIELDPLLHRIMEKVTEVMRADRSSLFLLDRERNELRTRIAQGSSEIRLPAGEGIAGWVAKTGETAICEDAYLDQRFRDDFDRNTGYRTRSLLCVPVRDTGGSIIGTVEVLNKLDQSPFSQKDVRLLEAFASLAGIAIHNARIHEELQAERNNLEIRVSERTMELEKAHRRSDELLKNILPAEVAEELKSRGKATPRRYDRVTVLFADFKDFTRLADSMNGDRLIQELDSFFGFFDGVVEKYGIEKIKTIGDSYMCAGGVPTPGQIHPADVVLAALEIRDHVRERNAVQVKSGAAPWELRIGIHTGPVLAGIVGKKKFAYDIWGRTVNVASRIESAGTEGRIGISPATYDLVKDLFVCTPTGPVALKNLGEMELYFVESILPELSEKGEGRLPGDAFYKKKKTMV